MICYSNIQILNPDIQNINQDPSEKKQFQL